MSDEPDEPKTRLSPCRLAMRVEDPWWVAYFAFDEDPEHLERAGVWEVGRLALGATRHPDILERWKMLMTDVLRREMEEAGMTVVGVVAMKPGEQQP